MTGYVNRKKKKKKTLGEVLTEEEVKFQKTHSKDEDACHRLCLHVPGGIYSNLVVGKEESHNDLTTPDLKRPLVKATVNTFKKAISFKNDLFSDGEALATLTSFWGPF